MYNATSPGVVGELLFLLEGKPVKALSSLCTHKNKFLSVYGSPMGAGTELPHWAGDAAY